MTKEERLRGMNPMAYPGLKNNNIKLPLKLVWLEVLDYFEMEQDQLRAKTSRREIIIPRHVFFYLARKYTSATLSRIGDYASGENFTYNHATVWNGVKKVEAIMDFDSDYRYAVNDITQRFENVIKGGKK